jgi:hypothetical protein
VTVPYGWTLEHAMAPHKQVQQQNMHLDFDKRWHLHFTNTMATRLDIITEQDLNRVPSLNHDNVPLQAQL